MENQSQKMMGEATAAAGQKNVEFDRLLEKVRHMKIPELNVHTNRTRYKVVRRCCKGLGWGISDGKKEAFSLSWLDCGGITAESSISALNPLQKLNHFPGMSKICQKCKFALTYNRLATSFPSLFNFHPRTFCLPKEKESLKKWWQLEVATNKQKPIVIAKPDGGCQGQGIFLTNDLKELEEELDDNVPTAVQQYLDDPYLIDGFKFDLRVYVVVTSCMPSMRAFQHEEGLVRFCTEKYCKPRKENLKERYMHLTNYAINKLNENFHITEGDDKLEGQEEANDSSCDEDESEGNEDGDELPGVKVGAGKGQSATERYSPEMYASYHKAVRGTEQERERLGQREKAPSSSFKATDSKWSLSKLYEYLARKGEDVDKLKREIEDVVTKTILSIQPSLQQEYKALFPTEGTGVSGGHGFRCFEILGFDVMLDRLLKPWVIEVNHSPSLHIDSDLDTRIKVQVVHESLVLGSVDADDLMGGACRGRPLTLQEEKEHISKLLSRRYSKQNFTTEKKDDDEEELSRKLSMLRESFEDGHCGGFKRILPFPENHPQAEAYRQIQTFKPSLFKDSPVTERRRKAIEAKRKRMEAMKERQRALVGDRPAWGSGGNNCSKVSQKEDEALDKLRKSLLLQQQTSQDTSRAPPPLPRVAHLKSYERSFRKPGDRKGYVDASDNHEREHSPRLGDVRGALSRQTCPVRVQTLSFAGLCIGGGGASTTSGREQGNNSNNNNNNSQHHFNNSNNNRLEKRSGSFGW